MLDQSNAGFASAAMSERGAQAAIRASATKGYLDGKAMAEMFAWLRPTDLVWRYWVSNYVQGRSPAPFDVLFWNADTTRMAAALHKDLVDLSVITADTYVIGGVADHISPWQACYRSAQLLGSKDNRFVLSTSGHIAALVNPPGNPSASFSVGQVDDSTPEEWVTSADNETDSWWPDYVAWLGERSGPEVDAPQTLGGPDLPPLAPAPGTYVYQS